MTAVASFWQDEPRWLRLAASPHIFVFACSWLIVMTVIGTLAQADIGLWQAQERYFSAWILPAFGWLPLPGARFALTATGLNLLAMLFTRRGTRSPGLFLLHAGTLLLLGGALMGGALRREGSMALATGEISSEMRSWRHHDLAVLVPGASMDQQVTFGEGLLRPGATLTHPDLPFPLTVVEQLTNCSAGPGDPLVLRPLPTEREAERNQAGLLLRMPDGSLKATWEGASTWIALGAGAQAPRITMYRSATRLPFAIELTEFHRENHPGTAVARQFSSAVVVHENAAARRVVISMNQPLRIGTWTLYQQSYVQTAQGDISVLAVVHDRFSLSPYIASLVMCLGLLIHMFERMRKRGET